MALLVTLYSYSLLPIRYSLNLRRFGGELLALFDRLFDGADHVKGLLRQMIVLAFAQSAETLDGVGEVDEFAGRAGKHFGDEERLRQEAFDLAGAGDGDLVLFAQFVHAENGDDVLQRFVFLQDLLDHARGLVVLVADDQRGEHARGRIQRVHRGINALFRDRAVEVGRRVEMGEGRRRRRIGVVVGRNV